MRIGATGIVLVNSQPWGLGLTKSQFEAKLPETGRRKCSNATPIPNFPSI